MRLRGLDVASDATTLHELDALSFADNADYEAASPAQFRSDHLGAHDLEAKLGDASDNPRALALDARVGTTPGFRNDAYGRPVADRPPASDASFWLGEADQKTA